MLVADCVDGRGELDDTCVLVDPDCVCVLGEPTPACDPVTGCDAVLVVDPLPSTELLFDIPDELRTLLRALELA